MAVARDFKHRAQGSGPGGAARSRKKKGARATARPADERGPRQSSRRGRTTLFVFGLLLGFAAGIGVMVFDVPDRMMALNETTPLVTDDGHGGPAADAAAAAQAEVEFAFYDNLPEITVLLDAKDLEQPTAAPEPPRPPTQPPSPTRSAPSRERLQPPPAPPVGAAPVSEAVPARKAEVVQRAAAASTPPTAQSAPAASSVTTGAAGATNSRYLMQVASFRRLADAEKTRATLGFAGLRARIVSVSLDDGSQRHRVQLEPVKGEARLKAVRKALELNGFSDPLVVRIKAG